LFDPEVVGYMLKSQLGDQPFTDFQHWPAWRQLVGPVAAAIVEQTAQSLVMVQTVTNQSYWHELSTGMASYDLDIFHIVLDCQSDELRRRIDTDELESGAREWRLDHVGDFGDARAWLASQANAVIDTTYLTPEEVADRVLAQVA
jgi:hypothetical protein